MTTTAPRPTAVGALRERVIKFAERVTTPLVPADYLDVIDPLRSGADLRGRIVAIQPETRDAVTVVIKPGRGWRGHTPGQYVRIGIDVDGVRQWRAYSLTSKTGQDTLAITVKAIPDGKVSNHLVRRAGVGTVVQLDQAAGEFTLGAEAPAKILFLTAGSGVTPVMGMLRNMTAEAADVIVVHSAPTAEDVIFGAELRAMARQGRIRLVERHTDNDGMLDVARLDDAVDDIAERLRARRSARRTRGPVECRWDRRATAHRALPTDRHHRRRRRHGQLHQDGHRPRHRRIANPARRRRSRRRPDAIGLPDGHLLRLRGAAATRRRARPAHRRRHHRRTRRQRPNPNLRLCRRGFLRHRSLRSTKEHSP
jgi:ferredoxin-NADP reductase